MPHLSAFITIDFHSRQELHFSQKEFCEDEDLQLELKRMKDFGAFKDLYHESKSEFIGFFTRQASNLICFIFHYFRYLKDQLNDYEFAKTLFIEALKNQIFLRFAVNPDSSVLKIFEFYWVMTQQIY